MLLYNIHTDWPLPLSHDFYAVCPYPLGSLRVCLNLTLRPLFFPQPPEHRCVPRSALFSVLSLRGQPPTLPASPVTSLASESQIHYICNSLKVQTSVYRDQQVLSHSFFCTCLSCCHAAQAELKPQGNPQTRTEDRSWHCLKTFRDSSLPTR